MFLFVLYNKTYEIRLKYGESRRPCLVHGGGEDVAVVGVVYENVRELRLIHRYHEEHEAREAQVDESSRVIVLTRALLVGRGAEQGGEDGVEF